MTTDTVKIYFIYDVEVAEIKPAAHSSDNAIEHTIGVVRRRYSMPYEIPLKGGLGSGHILTFPAYMNTNVKELGIIMPDIDSMINEARLKGKEEFKDELRAIGLKAAKRELKDILFPPEEPSIEESDWYND